MDGGRSRRINVTMEAWLLEAVDGAAKVRGLTRSAFIASAARDKIYGAAKKKRSLTRSAIIARPSREKLTARK